MYFGTYTFGKSEGIYTAWFDRDTGAIEDVRLVAKLKNPSFLAIHPNRKFLYSVSEIEDYADAKGGAVAAFAIDPSDGGLTLVNHQSSKGENPCHVVVDRSGKYALVANYGGGSVASLPIGVDGKLGPAVSSVQHTGSSVNAQRQKEPHAHSINVSPDNRLAMVADLGLDKVLAYQLDPATGKLAANDPPSVALAPGAGPRHFAFHPDGKLAFVNNELDSTVTSLRYDPTRGAFEVVQTLSTLPEGGVPGNSTAEVRVHPSGKFVYVSNRGHDSIAMFAVDPATGKMTALGHQSTGGRVPRNFNLDPTGRFLLAANQDSDTVVVHRIDPESGRLERTEHTAKVPTPVCVRFWDKWE